MDILGEDDCRHECNHCGFVGDESAFDIDDEATDELQNTWQGDVGLVAVCPECGGPVLIV